jgi:diguanylate cyclase (GGDEF)-like protein
MNAKLKEGVFEQLTREEGSTDVYRGVAGDQVVGSLRTVPRVPWAVLAEIPADTAYLEVRRFRNMALLIVLSLLTATGLIAYRFGLLIVRPLDRLTKGAAGVAAGDLAVDLPSAGGGEVGYLTYVFNHMVSRLRANRAELDSVNATLRAQNEELERLSATDALTGLANRRQLTQRLVVEVERSERTSRPFAVLMADVDQFKSYNDAFGHPAGDAVLKVVGEIIRKSTRGVDCAARYGGEEFCVMLAEATTETATVAAERIRTQVASYEFPGSRVTLSLGIAQFPKDGNTWEAVVASADAALYEAKNAGRDRVALAGSASQPAPAASAAPPKSGTPTRSGRSRR